METISENLEQKTDEPRNYILIGDIYQELTTKQKDFEEPSRKYYVLSKKKERSNNI